MALEHRDGNLYYYYYRSVRHGEEVRKVYVGAGAFARISHEEAILRRTAREAERERQRAELEFLEALAAPVLTLSEAAEVLVRAHLIAAGYRRYQGKWRRARSA